MGVLQRTARLSTRVFRAGLTPSLVTYFFWIGCITSVFGVWTLLTYTPIEEYLCDIPGEVNITNGWTVGCGNCSDTLMLCGKSDCWTQAFNLTWQLDASTANGQYYDAFQEAALDSTCNALVMSATSPASMLSNIEDRRLSPSKPQVSEACVTWNCRVLVQAFMRSLGPQLTGPGTCTNDAPSVKPVWQADVCSCDAETITMEQATSFRTLCGAMATGLRSAVYDRHLAAKDSCYSGSMAVSAAANTLETSEFAVNVNCEAIFENTQSTIEWFAVKNYLVANLAAGATFDIPSFCRRVMCSAFVATLQLPECGFTTNASLMANGVVTTTNLEAIATECANEGLSLTLTSMCEEPSFNVSAYCEALVAGRRLDTLDFEFTQAQLQAAQRTVPLQTRASSQAHPLPEKIPRSGHAVLQEAVVGYEGVEEQDDLECLGDSCSRRMQTVTSAPAPAATGNLQEYTTTPWSTCTCYMQCVPGVRTRSVSCPAGVTCQEPKPSSAQSCVCKHCSDCDVLMFVLITSFAYLFQGVLSFLLWLGFVMVAFLEEDDYTEMSISMKCLGCFCKFLPMITKLMTYVTMLLIILITVTALIPIGEPFSDCKGSSTFTVLAIGGICVWAVQLLVGVYMHRFKPMPPWLHTASSSGAMRFLFKPLNAVGP